MLPRRIAARQPEYVWPILASAIALIPLLGGVSTTNVFFVRDLGMYFWPRHLWAWHSWRSGDWPLWDPYAGGGQSAVADALNHFFLIPVTIVRALTPPVVGFNFWVAAPFPALALGTWLWLRRRVSPAAAFVGAAVVSLSGPTLSAGNFPNMSWTVALIPWILSGVERVSEAPGGRRVATLAVCVGLQALAGEPVTFLTNSALVVAYAAVALPFARLRELVLRLLWVVAALTAGVLLAAVQLMPLMFAASRSMRGVNLDHTFWSLHPLSLNELLVPHLFGHVYYGNLETLPWVRPLNGGREPLLYSLYVGLSAFVLALIRGPDQIVRRWRTFWWAAFAAALLGALGEYTFVYPAVSRVVPILMTLRFPVKYVVVAVFAIAALAATGADALIKHYRNDKPMERPTRAFLLLCLIGSLAALLGIGGVVDAVSVSSVWETLGRFADVDDPGEAAEWIQGANALWLRLSAFALVLGVLVAVVWQRHRLAPLATWAICGLAVLDPLIVNADLHPTLPAGRLGPPEWFAATRPHPEDRVYVGGRLGRGTERRRRGPVEMVDSPHKFQAPAEWTVQEALTMYAIQFAYTPSAWGIRELISYDLPQLWPREYVMMLRKVRDASPEDRLRFLRRTGARYCFMQEAPYPGAPPLSAPALSIPMALYECAGAPQRVYVTDRAIVEPDLGRHIDLMLDEQHRPLSSVLLERTAPAPEGTPGTGVATPTARILRGRNTELVVSAETAATGGYLNVIDSFDPFWRVEVDGRPATLLRANGLFRAVHLTAGHHEVRFVYRPMPFYVGLLVTGTVSLMLLVGCWWERIRALRRSPVVYQKEL